MTATVNGSDGEVPDAGNITVPFNPIKPLGLIHAPSSESVPSYGCNNRVSPSIAKSGLYLHLKSG